MIEKILCENGWENIECGVFGNGRRKTWFLVKKRMKRKRRKLFLIQWWIWKWCLWTVVVGKRCVKNWWCHWKCLSWNLECVWTIEKKTNLCDLDVKKIRKCKEIYIYHLRQKSVPCLRRVVIPVWYLIFWKCLKTLSALKHLLNGFISINLWSNPINCPVIPTLVKPNLNL